VLLLWQDEERRNTVNIKSGKNHINLKFYKQLNWPNLQKYPDDSL
jgi:hypothetical protein